MMILSRSNIVLITSHKSRKLGNYMSQMYFLTFIHFMYDIARLTEQRFSSNAVHHDDGEDVAG